MGVGIRFLAPFNNLKAVFLFQVALPVILLIGLILAFTLNIVGDMAEERLQRDLRQVARAVQLPVATALEENNVDQLNASLASVFEISEVYGAYLFDTDGERLVSFGSVNPSRRQADRALEIGVDGQQEFDLYEEISGRNVYSFFLPIFDTGGQPNGLLQVTRRRRDIEQELTELNRWAWGSFSAVIVLMLGSLAVTHQRSIGKPFNRVLQSMEKVESGDRDHRASLEGPGEVQQIAGRLNTMLDAIQRAQEEARNETREKEEVTEKLRHAETMAALGQVSAGVAHELGAPLSVVDGRAQRLLRNNLEEKDKAELETIRQQVERMSSLVQQLLSFGRSSRAHYAVYEIHEIFKHLRESGIDSENRVAVSPGPEARIKTDLFSLEQALNNLFHNARQASPEGPVRASWEVDTEQGLLRISVDDAGPGIDPAIRENMFEPFVTTKAPGVGSGMGLAIVHRVIRDHRGSIRVEESDLGGTRFVLSIPLADEVEEEAEKEA